MRSIALLALVLLSSPVAAQRATPRLEVGVDLSHWRLDMGNATVGPTTRASGTARAALLIPSRLPASLGVSTSYAPEDGSAPGLLAIHTEFLQRVLPAGLNDMNLFLGAGAGILRFSSREQRELMEECLRSPGCIYEGPHHPGGWRTVLSASAGADVPLAAGAVMQPVVQLVKPIGGDAVGGGRDVLVRLGLGLAWRP
jgi:hypothetical protein